MTIFELKIAGLEELMLAKSQPKYRAKQIWDYVFGLNALELSDITNISKELREELKQEMTIFDMSIEAKQESKQSGAIKYLIRLHDGNYVEAVRLQYEHGYSLCISSQVGCRMGCNFCASTLDGMARNLKAYELIEQVVLIGATEKQPITHIVLMGMGEPLDNYDNVLEFLRQVHSKEGLNISHRHITLSTCGLVDKIKQLADEKLQITLAVSLHNPFDEQRSEIMPINRKYNIDELFGAIDYYVAKTNRRVSLEYALIAGNNDTPEHSKRLVKLLKNRQVHINLIPINPISEREYRPTDKTAVYRFRDNLIKYGVNATVRREMGDDIDGACGQLRRKSGGRHD